MTGAVLERGAALAPAVAERLAAVRGRLAAAGGDPGSIRIVAVTKTFGPEAVIAALMAGVSDIGENYASELVDKAEVVEALVRGGDNGRLQPGLPAEVRWHFLGAIQRNKVARLSAVVTCWQSVGRLVEAEAIARRAPDPRPAVFVEVNVAGAGNRPGAAPADVPRLVEGARDLGCDVRGLMAVAPASGGADAFLRVRHLADELGLEERSLGMSGDLEAAVAAGTTMVRVGTSLFGNREP